MSKHARHAVRLRQRDGDNCSLCSLAMIFAPQEMVPAEQRGAIVTVDHIQPQVRGGPNRDDNLRLAHAYCNSRRGDTNNSFGTTSVKYATLVLAPLLSLDLVDPMRAIEMCPRILKLFPHLLVFEEPEARCAANG